MILALDGAAVAQGGVGTHQKLMDRHPDSTAGEQTNVRSNAFLAIFSAGAAILILLFVLFGRQVDLFGVWMRFAGGSEALTAQWEDEGATTGEQIGRSFGLIGKRLAEAFANLGFHPPAGLLNWSNFALLPIIAQAYQQVNLTLQRLGERPAASATPAERAAQVTKLLPESEQPVANLLAEYQKAAYSPTCERSKSRTVYFCLSE